MTHFLVNAENPQGYKLEEVLLAIRKEIIVRATKIVDDHRPEARQVLETNDAHTYFEAIGAQVITGPTLTNVNDFRAILVT